MFDSKKTLGFSIALAACIAAPTAFAQDAAKTAESQEAMAQQATPPMAEQADKSAEPAKSWSELDVNSNGSLSTSEASPMDSLAKVFGEADADADGELTQDEYKTWLAANGAKQQPDKQGG